MERFAFRRPDAVALAGAVIVVAGLIVAIILGHLLGDETRAAEPAEGTRAVDLAGTDGWAPIDWSPDGTVLLVGRDDAWGLATETSSVEGIAGSLVAWWPGGGRTLSFVRDAVPLDRLILRGADGSERVITEAPGILAVAWSLDGQTWAVSSEDGLAAGLLGAGPTFASPDRPLLLAISPSGDRLAFARGDFSGGRIGTLVIIDLVRDERTWVGSMRVGADDVLAWSPSGRFLALTGRRDAELGLFLLRPGSLQPVLVIAGADPGTVRWSPDGLWLAGARLASAGPVTELLVAEVRAMSVGLRSLGTGRAAAWGPSPRTVTTVQPDGRLVATAVEGIPSTALASDAEPICPVAASIPTHRIAYCWSEGGIRVLEAPPE